MSQKQTQPPVEKCHPNCPYCCSNSYTTLGLFDNSVTDGQKTPDILSVLTKDDAFVNIVCVCVFSVGLDESLVLAFPSEPHIM